ncbi:hypothetical protein AB0F11_19775 [Streptomyces sp. NPDC032472]|uniref:hypothetical protein n=1 Tax=Streptomyces sp. NPDC032472 TaxID=3155018 RepID=UPI0034030B99
MRVMLRAHLDTMAANEGVRSGALPAALKKLMDTVRPEAAYFGPNAGVRTWWMVFDMQDSAQMPALLDDLYRQFNAEIEITPVMDREGLEQGLKAAAAQR